MFLFRIVVYKFLFL